MSLLGGSALPWDLPAPKCWFKEEEEEPPIDPMASVPPPGNVAEAQKGNFWTSVFRGMLTMAIMGVNAFCAAMATQVYKVFTQRWREGGGSDIPVIATSPGSGSATSPSSPDGNRQSSSDFLNRYRD